MIRLNHSKREGWTQWEWVQHQHYSSSILEIIEEEVRNSSLDINNEIITPLHTQLPQHIRNEPFKQLDF